MRRGSKVPSSKSTMRMRVVMKKHPPPVYISVRSCEVTSLFIIYGIIGRLSSLQATTT